MMTWFVLYIICGALVTAALIFRDAEYNEVAPWAWISMAVFLWPIAVVGYAAGVIRGWRKHNGS